MSDSKKTDLPDLPEKIEPQATEFKEESLAPIRPVEDSTTTALADALASSFKIIQGLMVGLVVIFLGSGFWVSFTCILFLEFFIKSSKIPIFFDVIICFYFNYIYIKFS